jgi:hypothetical protein
MINTQRVPADNLDEKVVTDEAFAVVEPAPPERIGRA